MASGRYIVGIDLGTTHTAMAYAEAVDSSPFPRIRTFDIPQTVSPGVVERRPLLPSCIYLPAEKEFPDDSLVLPWSERTPRTDKGVAYTVGEFARTRGVSVPGRLISSAKSWLSQPGSKRRHALLPWNADAGVCRMTPVDASELILQHLASAWNFELGRDKRNGKLCDQKIVLCVPASFDAAARDLTMEAARRAGLIDVTLLEEPQAAFYAWIAQARESWRTQLQIGDRVLIVDVGGGTTDFTLISADDDRGSLALRRIAVGDHILLGGDNMDLALARSAIARLEADGKRLDPWHLRGLALACRDAKEQLLKGGGATRSAKTTPIESVDLDVDIAVPVLPTSRLTRRKANAIPDDAACLYIRKKPKKSLRKPSHSSGMLSIEAALAAEKALAEPVLSIPILGRGAAVIGSSVNASLLRVDAERVILEGFLEPCAPDARPAKAARTGLRELGLDYAADPSISKHLATFLASANRQAVHEDGLLGTIRPTAILFNGGVMKSPLLRARAMEIVNAWMVADGCAPLRELSGADPELAVANGAVYFARVHKNQGVRICGGVPRSYYVGIESLRPAVPGKGATVSALCVVPFGMDEGSGFDVPEAEFGLVVGEPAQFRFFSAAERRDDRIGDRVEIRQDAIRELEPVETTIPATLFDEPGTVIPVRLKSMVTEMGTLELWFHAVDGAGAWKLELNVRE